MKTKKIKNYVEKHIKAIKALTNNALLNWDVETIHQWRIAVKKLKALMRMMETVSADFSYKKNFNKIKTVYRLLGGIREIQLQLAHANGHQKGFWTKYRLLLKKEMDEKQDYFLHKLNTPLSKKFEKIGNHIADAVEDTPSKKWKLYFEKQAAAIQKKINKLDFSDAKAMHDLRKLMKDYAYNAKLDEKIAAKTIAKYSFSPDLLENTQTTLGDWHDLDVLTQQMKQRQSALLLQNGENETFLNFTTGLEVEKDILKNKLMNILGKN